jgi:MoxR-like ATPase
LSNIGPRNKSDIASVALTPAQGRRLIDEAVAAVAGVLHGHEPLIRVVFAAVLGRGHILLEDVPGVGKTTLARAVARTLGDSFARVQFTADMLPSDVLGTQVLVAEGRFEFKPGPLFAQVVLLDEINRASPKTQSATLEAMAEGAVTIDLQTYPLPAPFLVIATQNPVEHHGAYPLPESQLDRFAVGLTLGYPDAAVERALLLRPDVPEHNLAGLAPLLPPARLLALQALVDQVRLAEPVADYLLAIVRATREHENILLGCSPRGALLFAAACRATAFMAGRDYVLPDDVKALASVVLAHRLVAGSASHSRIETRAVVAEIVESVPAPR